MAFGGEFDCQEEPSEEIPDDCDGDADPLCVPPPPALPPPPPEEEAMETLAATVRSRPTLCVGEAEAELRVMLSGDGEGTEEEEEDSREEVGEGCCSCLGCCCFLCCCCCCC